MAQFPASIVRRAVRAFIAVFPPPEIQAAAIAQALETVQRLGECASDKVRWVRPENVHLTLRFLGNVQKEILGGLCAALEEACAGHAPFDVALAGFGAFPSARRARILWVGVGVGSDRLRALATDLQDTIAPLGFERDERAFTPHLTLGRIRGRPASFDLATVIGVLGFQVRRVELTESTLSPEGAAYRTIKAFTLKKRS